MALTRLATRAGSGLAPHRCRAPINHSRAFPYPNKSIPLADRESAADAAAGLLAPNALCNGHHRQAGTVGKKP
jgi:hypothetical protein